VTKEKPVKLSFSVTFQVKYCLIVAATFVVASVLLYFLLDKALGGGYRESLRTLYFLDQNLPLYLSIMALLLTLFLLILTLVVTLLVSHQIAGPVFRYEDVLQQVIAGTFPRNVATRQTDQLKLLVGSLNNLTDRCRDTFKEADQLSVAVGENLHQDDIETEALLTQITLVRQQMSKDGLKGLQG